MRFPYLTETRNPRISELIATQSLLNVLGGMLMCGTAGLMFVGAPVAAKVQKAAIPLVFGTAGLTAIGAIAIGLRLKNLEIEIALERATDQFEADDERANAIYYRQTRRQHVTEHAIAVADPRQPEPAPELEQEELPAPERQGAQDAYSNLAAAISNRLARHGCFLIYEGGTAGFSTILLKFRPVNGTKARAVENLLDEVQLAAKANTQPIFSLKDGLIELELPRKDREIARWEDFLKAGFRPDSEPVTMVVGVDINRRPVLANLSQDSNIVHFLVAGTTGAGKTALVQGAIASLVLRYPPGRVQVAIIDPKCVDFAGDSWQGLEHLYHPVINEVDEAIDFLELLAEEMDKRYERVLKPAQCKNIEEFNRRNPDQKLPRIVTLIDEIREFTEVGEREDIKRFENAVARLGGKARAAGLHLLCSTQYPLAKVLPTKIKANLGTRIGLMTATNVESQVIIDSPGCENLLGAGDMLYRATGKIQRLQSLYLEEHIFADMAQSLGILGGRKQQAAPKPSPRPKPPREATNEQLADWFIATVEAESHALSQGGSDEFTPPEIAMILTWLSQQFEEIFVSQLCEQFPKLKQNTACFLMERAAEEKLGKVGGAFPELTFISHKAATDGGGKVSTSVSTSPHSPPHRLHTPKPSMHKGSTSPHLHISTSLQLPPNWVFPDPCEEISPHLRGVVVAYKCSGIGKIRTIKEVWGLERSGTDPRYKSAENQYKSILNDAGFEV